MKPTTLVNAPLAVLLVAASLALTSPTALAQGGPPPGKGGGGHTTASTNLSYPAVFTATPPTLNGVEGSFTLGGTLGETWSYGCGIPVEEFPNTSCMKLDGTFMTLAECAEVCGSVTPERIYWQRENPVAVWQAGSLLTTDTGGRPIWPASHVDWGDNMESQTWGATSVIRVETTAFATLLPDANGDQMTQVGFQMWHVSGKGPDELWGVRATDPTDPAAAPLPYVYDSPYAIIHAPRAHISFTKLAPGAATCPTAAAPSPFFGVFTWDEAGDTWMNGETGLCTWNDLAYTVELNIGGKFVHGYNWQMSRVPPVVCQVENDPWVKEGWWRLTYHGATDAVDFSSFVPTADSLKAPVLPPAGPATLAATEEEGDTGPLYAPVVDTVNNLTYIDICIKAGKGGGGKR